MQLLAARPLAGAPTATLLDLAEEARWEPPDTLTAVLLPSAQAHDTLPRLGSDTLNVAADALAHALPATHNVLLVPDAVRTRNHLLYTAGHDAVVGPVRPWTRVEESLQVALRAPLAPRPEQRRSLGHDRTSRRPGRGCGSATVAGLRSVVLAPLDGLTPGARARLTETLQAWLLHLGRRGDAADVLQGPSPDHPVPDDPATGPVRRPARRSQDRPSTGRRTHDP